MHSLMLRSAIVIAFSQRTCFPEASAWIRYLSSWSPLERRIWRESRIGCPIVRKRSGEVRTWAGPDIRTRILGRPAIHDLGGQLFVPSIGSFSHPGFLDVSPAPISLRMVRHDLDERMHSIRKLALG